MMEERPEDEKLVSLLALERCETYVAHISALIHAVPENDNQENARNIMHIVHNMSRDISLLKGTME